MCDYSLEMYGSRPARDFERYVTSRFPSGSIGLTAPGDCATAICIQYDTPMILENIPKDLQAALKIGEMEEVVFVKLDRGSYRDGVRFANGKQISLQQLSAGVGVFVVSLLEAERPRRSNALPSDAPA
ncbi:MAG: hypothetical protein K2X62_15125 [Beijerinckiaceae bacterium]|nr:hypothetical protein [Beijerinckiaceae bacterium]